MRSPRGLRRAVAATATAAVCGATGIVSAGPATAVNHYHAYAVVMQHGAGITAVRGTWRDFEPGLVHPILNLNGCYNDADVNSAVWLLMSGGTQIEMGYTVEACGPVGRLLAYRYVAITDPAGNQSIAELDRRGHETDSLLDRFAPNDASHTYLIQRAADPHVWVFALDGRIVHRWRSAGVLSAYAAETGIESYQPSARVRVTFGGLGVQRGGRWSAWQSDATICTSTRMSGLRGPARWTAHEN